MAGEADVELTPEEQELLRGTDEIPPAVWMVRTAYPDSRIVTIR